MKDKKEDRMKINMKKENEGEETEEIKEQKKKGC